VKPPTATLAFAATVAIVGSMRGVSRPVLPLVFTIFLLAVGTVLAVLQVGWVNAASRAEEQRVRGTLDMGAMRVRFEAEDEIQVLLSLLRVSADDLARRDWSRAAEAAAFWHETASFPKLLVSAYIARFPLTSAGYSYSQDTGEFAACSLPSSIRDEIAASLSRAAGDFRPVAAEPLADGTTLFVVPTYREASGGQGAARETVGAVAVAVDTGVLFTQVVPALMEKNLLGFPFRVIDTVTGLERFRSAGADHGRAPEVRIGLDAVTAMEARFLMSAPGAGDPAPRDVGRRTGSLVDDPSVAYWLFRARADRAQMPGPGEAGHDVGRMVLEVYYPNKPLESVILGRRILGIGAGVGILSILVASASVLFSLYRRTALLRANEQEFVASMSHELRTPISVLQAMSDNLSEGVVTDPARLPRYARVIHDQTKRLSGMVESILFYSGLQANASKAPTLVTVDLGRLLQEVTHPLGELAAGKGSTLRLVTESLPERVCSDPTALRLVLENLVTNAIRHAEPGEIRLTVSRRAFDLLRICVEDDGPGIPQREQARIFEPFVRGERSVREQRPGSGLGLHLVKRVCAMLSGTVTLESPYTTLAEVTRRGCRFTVVIPCKERCDHAG
jgi:signal transduction histidine kinase